MSQLCVLVCTCVLVASLGSDARAQQPPEPAAPAAPAPPPDAWTELTIGGGLQVYSGDTDTLALSGSLDWSQQFRHVETEVSANVNVARTFGADSAYTGTLSSVTRWLAATRSGPHLYPMVHVLSQHDESAGIDLRATVAAGIGSHLVENARIKLTLEGGLGFTKERARLDQDYPTIVVSPTLRWKINPRTQFTSGLLSYFNTEVARDVRLHGEMDLNVQITPRVGLQNSLTISFDNVPDVGHMTKTTVQFGANIAFSLTKGTAPQR
jgi:putative salt-induced outer membrane protein YdiY